MATHVEKHCKPGGLFSNDSKKQVTARFAGHNSNKEYSRLSELWRQSSPGTLSGKPSSAVKHLGSMIDCRGSNIVELGERLRKANMAWRTFGGVWTLSQIRLATRLLIFRAVIIATLLAGLEALVLLPSQVFRLESWQCKKLRIMLKGEAAYHTNQWVRERTQTSAILSILLARRVRWIQTIAQNLSHHQLILATVTGKPNNAQYDSLDDQG
eukprot:16446800-Heterocapsa_arctica.AAC.1